MAWSQSKQCGVVCVCIYENFPESQYNIYWQELWRKSLKYLKQVSQAHDEVIVSL